MKRPTNVEAIDALIDQLLFDALYDRLTERNIADYRRRHGLDTRTPVDPAPPQSDKGQSK